MSDSRLARLEALLAAALEIPRGERRTWLDEQCGDDPGLRREIDGLLAAHRSAGAYFEALAGDIASRALLELDTAARPKLRIGPYRALDLVGRGGMGVVYRAERVDGQFDQQVAIKLLHLDMESPEIQARFLAERQLLARLSHPNIAALLDGGVTDEGRPYFVMEYVEGRPITSWCRRRALPVRDILRLFLDVVDAVSYLHRNLVVHRDLKPSNILIDEDGHVKLLDFGIAKLLAEGGQLTEATLTGQRLLTPDYAAPEQLTGDAVTTATDVYALGTVLYELLAGRKPHRHPAGALPVPEREMPTAPSAALRGRGADEEGPGPAHGWRRVAGDLDDICLMALRPEPDKRYASAEQLGQDIERYLDELPIRAGKRTFSYRLTRFLRRNRRPLAAAALLVVLVGVGFLRERGLRGEAERAYDEADREAAKALAVSDFLGELLSSADPSRAQGEELTVAEVLSQAAERLEGEHALLDQPEVEASVRLTLGRTYTSLQQFDPGRSQLERALALRRELRRPELEVAEVTEALGVLHYRAGEYDRAERSLTSVLDLRRRELGEEDPATLRAMSHLANVYWYQERFDEVEALDRRTLEIKRQVLGPHHPDTLRSMNGLAATLFSGARYAEAASLFEQALQVQRGQLGDNHPDTLRLINNLAAAHTELGRYRQAEPLAREVIDGRRRVLGAEHPNTGTAVHNLGVILLHRGRYEEAEAQLEEAIRIRRREPLADGQLYSRSFLADVYREQGRLEEARQLYLSVLERQREVRGVDDFRALRTASSLAELYLRMGELDVAESLLSATVESQSANLDPVHPDLLGSRVTLARLHNARGEHLRAEEVSRAVIGVGTESLAADHPLVLEAVEARIEALRGLGRLEEARGLAGRLHRDRRRVLGDGHPRTASAARRLDELGGAGG